MKSNAPNYKVRHFALDLERLVAIIGLSLFVTVILYGIPTVAELLLQHVGVSRLEGAIGDLAGYLALYFLGFRKTAVSVYLASKALEALLVLTGACTLSEIIWYTDILPCLACTLILSRKVFFSNAQPFAF